MCKLKNFFRLATATVLIFWLAFVTGCTSKEYIGEKCHTCTATYINVNSTAATDEFCGTVAELDAKDRTFFEKWNNPVIRIECK